MVLGLRTKSRKSTSVQVDYIIHLQEIKPWPPSQSLRSLRSVLIQWEHGDRNSGSTNQVVPSLGSGSGDGRIEFDESFRLPVTLQREMSIKGGDGDTFQKNCLEFNLYEPRRDKTVKGQLLGTVIVDLADYGIVRESLSISAPMNCKRSLRNTAQPVLSLKIQPVEKSRNRLISRDSLLRERLMERSVGESVSALMNEEYAEEAEGASFTEDDVSSHSSSIAVSSSTFESNRVSPPRKDMKRSEVMKGRQGEDKDEFPFTLKQRFTKKSDSKPAMESYGSLKESSRCSSSTDLSSDLESLENVKSTSSRFPRPSLMLHQENICSHSAQSSLSSIACEETDEALNTNMGIKVLNSGIEIRCNAQESFKSIESQVLKVDDEKTLSPREKGMQEPANAIEHGSAEDKYLIRHQENGQERQFMEAKRDYIENDDRTRKQISLGTDELSISRENHGVKGNIPNTDRLKHMKSVRSPLDSGRSNGSLSNERKDVKVYPEETRGLIYDRKVKLLEHRIQMLEGELREAAAIEVSLYSVVAEHGSSTTKVHAPARRLSRLYLHAWKENSWSRTASAARSVVSGLILVAKACGHDVPRLTFWLSNSVVLRAIVSQAFEEQQLPLSAGPFAERAGNREGNTEKSSLLKWKDSSSSTETISALHESFDDWEDPHTFTSALEKIESWIFSRIVESVWWQTLTPYMQSAPAKEIVRAMGSYCSEISSSGDQEQGNFSIELWKNAFRDSCERICPVRAGGHACGCLPLLSRLIMEHCLGRLDAAMFNAILRESADEIPTDPVSDPISDAKVLPIPAGEASFGAGAQLKNAIGNWSRWLSDLFGIEENGLLEGRNEVNNYNDNELKEDDKSFKSFHLLNALSDLMMLPKDMLLSRSIRKEVCPTFSTPLIKRILNTFVPDEFCPDLIPPVVLEALDSVDALETCEDSVLHFPCVAASIVYLPPSVALVANILGHSGGSGSHLTRSGSLVLRKSYTSDDELDELDSPLTSIIGSSQDSHSSEKLGWILNGNGRGNDVRFQLLREVWMNSEL